MSSEKHNMTQGSPYSLLIAFAIPVLLGQLFQQIYNITDSVIVGRGIGIDALTAVGSTSSLSFMIIGFCNGCMSGFAIPIAQRFGARDYRGLRIFVANSIYVCAAIALILTTVVCRFCRDILVLMRTPGDIFDAAYSYIFIIFLGIPFSVLYNMLNAIIRALGDSRTPLFFLIVSAVLNLGLDILFIGPLQMGVPGSAIATVISNALAGFACLFYLCRRFDILHIRGDEWRPRAGRIRILFGMGVPMGLQFAITAIGSVILQWSTNLLGSVAVAAVVSGNKVVNFAATVYNTLGISMATYTGQNVGARRIDRVRAGLRAAVIMGTVCWVIEIAVLLLFGRTFIQLFVDPSETFIIDRAQLFTIVNACSFGLVLAVNVFRNTIQGMGYSVFAILAGVLEMIARALVGIWLIPKFQFSAVCVGNPLAWLFADLFLIPAFFYCARLMRKKFEREDAVPPSGEDEAARR